MASSNGNCDDLLFCIGCKCTLIEFLFMAEDEEKLNQFLYAHGVAPKTMNCTRCGHQMKLTSNGTMFVCYKRYRTSINKKKRISKQCRMQVSSSSGTLFSSVHLSRKKICTLVALWVMIPPPRISFICKELKISTSTCVDWCRYLRDVCQYHIYHDHSHRQTKIGGIGKTVEIDKYRLKNESPESDDANLECSWIFGGIEIDQGSKNIFLIPVATCDSETLLKVIKDFVLPGTTIISNYWKNLYFNDPITESFLHWAVDGTYNLVDPEKGAHLQKITRLWRDVQSKLPKYGFRKEYLLGHLAEFVFKYKYSDHVTRIHKIFTAIASSYNKTPSVDTIDSHISELDQKLEISICYNNPFAGDSQFVIDISDLNQTSEISNCHGNYLADEPKTDTLMIDLNQTI